MKSLEVRPNRIFQSFTELKHEIEHASHHWGWILAAGVAFGVIGFLSISMALFTTVVSVAFLGSLLLLGGLVQVVHAFSCHKWGGLFLELLYGVLYAVAGMMLLGNPGVSALILTFLLAPLFMVSGIFRMAGAIAIELPHRGWLFVSGIASFAVGLMILQQWPASGLWVIGTLIGVEMVFFGASLSAFALALRKLKN